MSIAAAILDHAEHPATDLRTVARLVAWELGGAAERKRGESWWEYRWRLVDLAASFLGEAS